MSRSLRMYHGSEARAAGTGNTGEEAGRGLVPKRRTHASVLQTRNDGELIAVIFDDLEIRREFVIPAGCLGDKVVRVQSQRGANADHTTRWPVYARGGKGLKPRECEGNAGGAEKVAARCVEREMGRWSKCSSASSLH